MLEILDKTLQHFMNQFKNKIASINISLQYLVHTKGGSIISR